MKVKTYRLFVVTGIFLILALLISNDLFARFYYQAPPLKRSGNHSPIHQIPDDNSPITILAINGGGMRALIPLSSLIYLEHKTGLPISTLFDTIIATSSGSIIAAGLSLADNQGNASHSAEQVSKIFKEFKFDFPWYHRLLTLGGLAGPRFTGVSLHKTMARNFTNVEMCQLLTEVILPVFSTTDKEVLLISRNSALRNDSDNYFVTDVINASTAAPIFLPAVQLTNVQGKKPIIAYDAGLFLNNPALKGLIAVLKAHPKRKIILVSLGTGVNNYQLDTKEINKWGIFSWLHYLMYTLLDQNSTELNNELNELLNISHAIDGSYYSINVVLNPKQGNPFATGPKAIAQLEQNGADSVKQNRVELDQIAAALLDNQQLRQSRTRKMAF